MVGEIKSGISVIVCCYNSATRLPLTLKYLANQKFSDALPWEIIIVNNASTDNTSKVAETEWGKLQSTTPLKIVDENQPGLSNARRKGVHISKYSIILFCDDDNGLEERYLNTIWQIMRSNPSIGALGGCGKADNVPNWLNGHEEFYALGPQGLTSGDVTNTRGCLYGAGLAIRKEALLLLDKKQFKSMLSDRKKKSLLSGGDTEITYAIRLLGYKLWYDERLKFHHFISSDKFKLTHFMKLIFYIGYSWMALLPYHQVLNKYKIHYPSPSLIDTLYILKRTFFTALSTLLLLLTFRFSSFKRSFFKVIFQLGELFFSIRHFEFYKEKSAFLNSIDE